MGKCRFFKICKLADKTSVTCTETEGYYYGPGRLAGRGRDLQEKGKQSTYHKEYVETVKKKGKK